MEGEPQQRFTPQLEIELGGVALKLTYHNTTLFSFVNPYEEHDHTHLNHIWVVQDGQPFCAYDSPEAFNQLDELGFPHIRMPYPSESEVDNYIEYQMEGLDDEKL